MRQLTQAVLTVLLIFAGGLLFGAIGLALAGIGAGWLIASGRRGFLIAGVTAALFWLIAAIAQIESGQSQTLLSLIASLLKLSSASAWLLLIVSALLAFFAGGLGGWLGGSLQQVKGRS